VALLTDDRQLFEAAATLFTDTVTSYLKWGRGEWAAGGRVPGECSETLRDIFHRLVGWRRLQGSACKHVMPGRSRLSALEISILKDGCRVMRALAG
jgi:hypothetical protein